VDLLQLDIDGIIKNDNMGNYDIHYGRNYNMSNIPKTSDYDELVYIINYGMQSGIYQTLEGKYCGDKANILLTKWGYKEPQYEIY